MERPTQPKIIVVADNRIMGWMLTRALEQMTPPYPIHYCRTALEALAYIVHYPVAGVLTDYEMNAMDGMTLAEILFATWPVIPVLLMSDMPRAILQRQLEERATHVVAILTKPIALADLWEALRQMLAAQASLGDERQVAG